MEEVKIVDKSDVIKVRFKDNPFRFIIVEGEVFEVEVNFNGKLLKCNRCAIYNMTHRCRLRVAIDSYYGDIPICNYITMTTEAYIFAENIVLKKWISHISLFIASYMVYNAECANGQLR